MLFNSPQFAVFFIVVFGLYLILPHRWQNRLLLAASYFFYGSWDWRFLSLIWISTLLDYFCGLRIHHSRRPGKRKFFLYLSVGGNLAVLGFFKYFNFFSASLVRLLEELGFAVHPISLSIVLPVGISFYTFQTMSYTIDIYRNQLRPTRNLPDFALFVAFFPQLVAGPIERAKHLLPQMLRPRKVTWEGVKGGGYLILWGLFQKVFVADNLARLVDPVFAGSPPYHGAEVLFALYAFAFQIFCDFAGYSNIARGLARCLGFEIMVNFRLPYFSTNPRQFWQRWHISLSTWLRDYLYIPLGGNRRGDLITCRNLAITMLLGGLWHGAAWNFVLWGVFWALILIGYRQGGPLWRSVGEPRSSLGSRAWRFLRILLFFHLVCYGWLLFRAETFSQIGTMTGALLSGLRLGRYIGWQFDLTRISIYLAVLLFVEYWQYRSADLEVPRRWPAPARLLLYLVLICSIAILGVDKPEYFIYFQF